MQQVNALGLILVLLPPFFFFFNYFYLVFGDL